MNSPLHRTRFFGRAAILSAFILTSFFPACSASATNTLAAGTTDDQIRDVLVRVCQHQIHLLTDGDYPIVSPSAVKTAKVPSGIAWNYPWGVTLLGMSRAAEITGDTNVQQFVAEHHRICARYFAWLVQAQKQLNESNAMALTRSSALDGLMTLGSLDNCGAMGTAMLETMSRHPGQVTADEEAVVARVADWITQKQARRPDGTLWRPKTMGGTLWPDDLYMGGVFLVQWGKYTGDQKYIEGAARQIIHQAELEQDSDGLWFHGYFVSEKKPAPFKWGRGNGWVTFTLVETIAALPAKNSLRIRLLEILRKQIEGLKNVQAADGMWRQVLTQPELWEETSCSAMFAYGIARAANEGWIDKTNLAVARQAFAGVARNVLPDGAVIGTCKGTSIGKNLDYYAKRPRPDDDLHGIGPVLLAGSEILKATK